MKRDAIIPSPADAADVAVRASVRLPDWVRDGSGSVSGPSPLDVSTLVLWLLCAGVGVAGMFFRYERPMAESKPAVAIDAELLHVELTPDPLPSMNEAPPVKAVDLPSPAPLPTPAVSPLPSETPMVSAPEVPSVRGFEFPLRAAVEKAVASSPAAAGHSTSVDVKVARTTPAQPLTYGVGEGRQPAPDYPLAARRAGQEGVVRVRFSVGENGRVLVAETVSPSDWPLLNAAALRVIHERWRFRRGAPRYFEVSIRFELSK